MKGAIWVLDPKISHGIKFSRQRALRAGPASFPLMRPGSTLWSKIVDAKGRARACIYYRDEFHNRVAYLRFNCRYSVRPDYETGDGSVCILDNGCGGEPPKILQEVRAFAHESFEEARKRAREQAFAWLDWNFPQYKDPHAYWDDDDGGCAEQPPKRLTDPLTPQNIRLTAPTPLRERRDPDS